ncbi:MAG: hypothetical protein ACREUL_05470 [Steroidobacteraceae bacterium]
MKNPIMRLLAISSLAVTLGPIVACTQVKPAPPISGVLGKVEAVSSNAIELQTPGGVIEVQTEQPLTTYRQVPSDLSHVTSSSYVGVPSVRQKNGTQLAKLVMIFPPALRGAAEGSVLLDAAPGATIRNRMTNGSVSRLAVSRSRMTNGTVQRGNGTTLVVYYQDGAQTISVPENVPVTEIAPRAVTLRTGDTIYAATTKQANGTLATSKVFLFAEGPR